VYRVAHDPNTIDLVAPFYLPIYITPLFTNGSTLLFFEKREYYRITLIIKNWTRYIGFLAF